MKNYRLRERQRKVNAHIVNCVDEDEGEKDKDTSEATPFTVLYKVIHMYMHACTVV